MQEDEQASYDEMENHISSPLAPRRKGILLRMEIQNDQLEGTVLNVFTQQGGKDKKTGDQFADRDKVQILGAMDLPNGDVKNELFTLSVENYRDFKDYLNKKISIAVGVMASGRNVIFMLLKRCKTCFSRNNVKREKKTVS